jgi:hypothetical protein
MNILVQLFWICLAVFESDYEHEFLLALRLLEKVLNKLPLDRPGLPFEEIARSWETPKLVMHRKKVGNTIKTFLNREVS